MAKSSIRLLQKISSPSSSTISSRFFLFRSSPLRWPALTSNTAALSAALPCNLSAASGDNHSLEQAFSSFGEIVKSKVINDRETGRSRGFGFVTFKDEQAMRDAIERMNDQDLDGRSITVNEAQSRSGGGGGNGDGYGAPRRDGGGGGGYGGGGRDHGFGGGGGGGGGGGSWYLRGNGASDGNCRS